MIIKSDILRIANELLINTVVFKPIKETTESKMVAKIAVKSK